MIPFASRRIALVVTVALLLVARPAFAHENEPGGHLGGAVSFADATPDLGLGYEWTVQLRKKDKASVVWHVGAKSWNEPTNPDGLKGWTHTSNWIAVDLEQPARLQVTVERQQGVVFTNAGVPTVARAELVPALSLYAGWDETTVFEDHTFNNAGNFWSTVEFLGNAPNPRGKSKIVFKSRGTLPAGRYSVVIGGNPPPLASPTSYPTAGCDQLDPLCYAYTGPHGYRALLQAK